MITKIVGEQPFQVLTSNFSISPSNEGYTLQISADGKQYSNLFTVGAGVTRLVTGVAANSYYRLSGNQSKVSINWMKTCVTEGGSGSGTELAPVSEFPLGAEAGTVVAYNGTASAAGVYQYDGSEWIPVGVDDLSAYWTSAQTKDYVDSASTVLQEQIDTMDEVVSEALVDLNERIDEMSGSTGGGDILLPSTGFSQDDEIGSLRSVNGTEGSWAYWEKMIDEPNSSVTYTYHQNMPAGFTADIATINANLQNVTGGIQVNCFSGSDGDYFKIDYGYGDGATLLHYEANYSTPGSSGETQSYLVLNARIVTIACKMNISWANAADELILTIMLIKYADGEPHPGNGTFTPINNFTDNYLIDENTPGIPGGVKVLTADGAKTLATEDYVSAATIGKADKAYVDSAITLVEDHIYDVEKVAASALTELHDDILELSARTVDLSGYYTSGETDAAISAATSGKANAANVEGGSGIPKWNSQGIITGITGRAYSKVSRINGVDFYVYSEKIAARPNIYAPTVAGTAGDILVSTGSGAPVWSAMPAADVTKAYVDSAITQVQDQIDTMDDVVSAALVDLNDRKVESASVSTIWKGTTAEYDAIVTKDPTTLYIIVNNS